MSARKATPVAWGRAGKWAGHRVRYVQLSITPNGRLTTPAPATASPRKEEDRNG